MKPPRYEKKGDCCYDHNPSKDDKEYRELHLRSMPYERRANDEADGKFKVMNARRMSETE